MDYYELLKDSVCEWNEWRRQYPSVKPDLSGVNLCRVNLYKANLCETTLRKANLCKANLQGANLQGANLYEADLCGANLRGANLDYSCLPLWCGTFMAKIDDRLVWQIICSLKRFDVDECSEEVKKAVKCLDIYKNKFCDYRDDVDKI